jgi:hypothetical protein
MRSEETQPHEEELPDEDDDHPRHSTPPEDTLADPYVPPDA